MRPPYVVLLVGCAQVAAGAGVALPGLAAVLQLGRLQELQELDLQGAGTTDAFLAELAACAPRLTRRVLEPNSCVPGCAPGCPVSCAPGLRVLAEMGA